MNVTSNENNEFEWNIGHFNKTGIWTYYILFNYMGVALCSHLIHFVYRYEQRDNADILTAGLAFASASMSLTCGIQCNRNVIANYFIGGVNSCVFEAIAHVSFISMEFFCVTLLALQMYMDTFHKTSLHISQKQVLLTVVFIWFACTITTGLTAIVSEPYLLSAGVFCFFSFTSPAIAGILVPSLVISLVIMTVCHIRIKRYFTKMLPRNTSINIRVSNQDGIINAYELWRIHLRSRSMLLLFGLLVCWGFAAVTTIYELAVGQTQEWLVVAVGIGGVTFSPLVVVIYFLTSKSYKLYIKQQLNKLTCNKTTCFQEPQKFEVVRSKLSITQFTTRTKSSNKSAEKSDEEDNTAKEHKSKEETSKTKLEFRINEFGQQEIAETAVELVIPSSFKHLAEVAGLEQEAFFGDINNDYVLTRLNSIVENETKTEL